VQDALWAVEGWGEGVRWDGPKNAATSPWVQQQTPPDDVLNDERWPRGFDPGGQQLDWDSQVNGSNTSLNPISTLIDPTIYSSNPFTFGNVIPSDTFFDSNPSPAPQPQQQQQPQSTHRRRTTVTLPLDSSSNIQHDPQTCHSHSTHTCLTTAQEQQLLDIAMPDHRRSRPSSPPPPQKSPPADQPTPRNTKRMREPSPDDQELSPNATSPSKPHSTGRKKADHNVCEKRYRNKLNVTIALLRERIPSLRASQMAASKADGSKDDARTTGDDAEDDDNHDNGLEGLKTTTKSDKATILSKAIEYISHVEKSNERLAGEDLVLRARVEAFEKLVAAGALVCHGRGRACQSGGGS
jgi:hypothetical protein